MQRRRRTEEAHRHRTGATMWRTADHAAATAATVPANAAAANNAHATSSVTAARRSADAAACRARTATTVSAAAAVAALQARLGLAVRTEGRRSTVGRRTKRCGRRCRVLARQTHRWRSRHTVSAAGSMVVLHIVVMPTEDGRVSHAELVTFGQRRIAHGAREAAYVEDQVAGAHHQLRGTNRGHAAGAALRTEDAVRLRVG